MSRFQMDDLRSKFVQRQLEKNLHYMYILLIVIPHLAQLCLFWNLENMEWVIIWLIAVLIWIMESPLNLYFPPDSVSSCGIPFFQTAVNVEPVIEKNVEHLKLNLQYLFMLSFLVRWSWSWLQDGTGGSHSSIDDVKL